MTDKTVLAELQLESQLGGAGTEDSSRSIPKIDLAAFADDQAGLDNALWNAAVEHGFFQLINHGLSSQSIDTAFSKAKQFFELPTDIKAQYPLRATSNAGWEYSAQVRPSTGTADEKESYQITDSCMDGLWPSEAELPHFKAELQRFERECWLLGMRVLSSFARKLGFDDDFFSQAHDPDAADYKSTLRLLHYFAQPEAHIPTENQWRAGAHTDFDCLTLLFQRDGQGGLQVCPGKEATSMVWTPVVPANDVITCNIGDMLMRWSDDKLRSTLHRVRMPLPHEATSARYTVAFFCQANSSQIIEGPEGKYAPISAGDYLDQRLAANFAALQGY